MQPEKKGESVVSQQRALQELRERCGNASFGQERLISEEYKGLGLGIRPRNSTKLGFRVKGETARDARNSTMRETARREKQHDARNRVRIRVSSLRNST